MVLLAERPPNSEGRNGLLRTHVGPRSTAACTDSPLPLASGKHDLVTAEPQLTTPAAKLGSHDTTRARGLDDTTFVPFWITAHARTDAPIVRGSSLIGVIAWFLIWRVPTLLAGNVAAA